MADPLPIAEIVHAMPGRARLRIAARRGDAVFFASVATGLSTIPGVHKVEVRPLTGSVVILHSRPFARIATAAREARLFDAGERRPPPPATPAMAIDPKMVVGVGLGVFALSAAGAGPHPAAGDHARLVRANLTGLLSNGPSAEDGD